MGGNARDEPTQGRKVEKRGNHKYSFHKKCFFGP